MWSFVGTMSAHVWGYFGGMLGLNGSMLAHFEVLLGLCWPIWCLCWGQVRPSRAMLGLWQTAQPDFVSKTLLLSGTGVTKIPPEQVYVGLSWGYVGVCWDHVRPSWGCVRALSNSQTKLILKYVQRFSYAYLFDFFPWQEPLIDTGAQRSEKIDLHGPCARMTRTNREV